jgi:hypothetical protein
MDASEKERGEGAKEGKKEIKRERVKKKERIEIEVGKGTEE